MNYIILAIPVFFLFIAIEWVLTKFRQVELYRLNDSINDLSCGISQQVLQAFIKTTLIGGYIAVYEHWALLSIDLHSVPAWIVLFLGVDLCYYWFHRSSHRINAIWATHVVHHQSEEYNLAVALRQGSFQPVFSSLFYLPLALIGFPPAMFISMAAFNTLYQFWIHTRLIDRMGILEWFLNTPSHHRVHHGRNPKYLDKNYAGILIIWDRMFGTFQIEEEDPAYGIVDPLSSWNPIWANLHHWWDMAIIMRRTPRMFDRFKLVFMPPGWRPAGIDPIHTPNEELYGKYDPQIPRGLKIYAFLHFLPVVVATLLLLHSLSSQTGGEIIPLSQKSLLSLFILLSLLSLGGLFDKKSWAMKSEWFRLIATPVALVLFFYHSSLLLPVSIGSGATSIAFGIWLRHYNFSSIVKNDCK